MTDFSDIEHDSEEDGHTEALTEPLPPEQTDKQMLREDAREALAEKRKAESAKAIRARYSVLEYPEGTEAANEEWLSYDNPAIWTGLGQR